MKKHKKLESFYLDNIDLLYSPSVKTKYITFEYHLKVYFVYKGLTLGSKIDNPSIPIHIYGKVPQVDYFAQQAETYNKQMQERTSESFYMGKPEYDENYEDPESSKKK